MNIVGLGRRPWHASELKKEMNKSGNLCEDSRRGGMKGPELGTAVRCSAWRMTRSWSASCVPRLSRSGNCVPERKGKLVFFKTRRKLRSSLDRSCFAQEC